MSLPTIQERIDADRAVDKSRIDQDTIEGARAEIVSQVLAIAEHWQLKAAEWDYEEPYCTQRSMVCQEILDVLNEHLWDDEETKS
ncbi:hypothetical protein [Nocardia aurea]|uniref:hypothetical protein n=1 Tax=Nocardia aurea TaxID=2144174 RepID=UPI0033AB6BED